MRDLQKDLETCNEATPGPWDVFPEVCGSEGQTVFQVESGGDICDVADPYPRGENRPTENMQFIAEARAGWPHAIERAVKAEARNRELLEVLDTVLVNWGMVCACDEWTDECESCYHKGRIKEMLIKAKEGVV